MGYADFTGGAEFSAPLAVKPWEKIASAIVSVVPGVGGGLFGPTLGAGLNIKLPSPSTPVNSVRRGGDPVQLEAPTGYREGFLPRPDPALSGAVDQSGLVDEVRDRMRSDTSRAVDQTVMEQEVRERKRKKRPPPPATTRPDSLRPDAPGADTVRTILPIFDPTGDFDFGQPLLIRPWEVPVQAQVQAPAQAPAQAPVQAPAETGAVAVVTGVIDRILGGVTGGGEAKTPTQTETPPVLVGAGDSGRGSGSSRRKSPPPPGGAELPLREVVTPQQGGVQQPEQTGAGVAAPAVPGETSCWPWWLLLVAFALGAILFGRGD